MTPGLRLDSSRWLTSCCRWWRGSPGTCSRRCWGAPGWTRTRWVWVCWLWLGSHHDINSNHTLTQPQHSLTLYYMLNTRLFWYQAFSIVYDGRPWSGAWPCITCITHLFWYQAFTIEYDAETRGHQRDLGTHFDNAEITLNISLTDDHEVILYPV